MQLAGGSNDCTVYVWDAADGTLVQQLPGYDSMITRVASGGGAIEGGELFV